MVFALFTIAVFILGAFIGYVFSKNKNSDSDIKLILSSKERALKSLDDAQMMQLLAKSSNDYKKLDLWIAVYGDQISTSKLESVKRLRDSVFIESEIK